MKLLRSNVFGQSQPLCLRLNQPAAADGGRGVACDFIGGGMKNMIIWAFLVVTLLQCLR